MGNTCACIRHLNDVSLVSRGGSMESGHDETAAPASGVEGRSSCDHAHGRCEDSESLEQATQMGLQCEVHLGTLLQDGRFSFVMKKEHEDLRSRIDRAKMDIGNDHGPFSKDEAEIIMFHIALGMDGLHNHNILHRDLKASNVLIRDSKVGFLPAYYVADFECSIGVVGTRFFMAPEIVQALKNKVASKNIEVFSKEADVYSYGMTCYEVLTGNLPFEGHPRNDYDLVLCGERPRIPEYVDCWVKELLIRCWDVDCSKRPLFPEIIGILSRNSAFVREMQLDNQEFEKERYRKYEEKLLQQGLVVEPKKI